MYLQGETHYFIMAPTITSLENHGVFDDPHRPLSIERSIDEEVNQQERLLLESDNIKEDNLELFCRQVISAWLTQSGVNQSHVELFLRRPVILERPDKKAM